MLIMGQIISNSTDAWRRGRSKITRFQQARQAFETLQQRLASASLAPYWDYEYDAAAPTIPTQYGLRSDFVFRSGKAEATISPPSNGRLQGHAMIFTAPLGAHEDSAKVRFRSLINLWGCYVGFFETSTLLPRAEEFGLNGRAHFGLYEFCQPLMPVSESDAPVAAPAVSISNPQFVAENVILLVIRPLAASADSPPSPYSMAQDFRYDSAEHGHQLPASVRVIMVAIDKDSANWVTDADKFDQLIPENLFEFAASAEQIDTDLRRLESHLNQGLGKRLSYQIFDTTLQLSPSRWES